MEQVKLVFKSNNSLPQLATPGSSGFDIAANLSDGSNVESITLNPGQRKLIPTGLYMNIPLGYELQIRSRSGLAFKHGIAVLNGIGTIDSDYTGHIQILLINHGDKAFDINHGDRIAQGVFAKVEFPLFQVVESLDDTIRGEGGFGSTGTK